MSDAIKALFHEGGSLERIDRDGKNPLIMACMSPNLIDVAKTLIELGANIDVYRSGCHAGSPLHHAARKGLEQTVTLLLSHGANALVRNDDSQTPLEVARLNGRAKVVRAIENHICYFSGWVREIHGRGFLGALAPHLLSRTVWVVVIPCGPFNPSEPLKLELAVYSDLKDAQPCMAISLWKAQIEEPNLCQSDPTVTIVDDSIKSGLKLASASQSEKQQIQSLYNACRGISQVMPPSVFHNPHTPVEAAELVTASNNSIQSAVDRPLHQIPETSNTNGWGMSVSNDSYNRWGATVGATCSEVNSSGWMDKQVKDDYNGWGVNESVSNDSYNGWRTDVGATCSEANSGGWMDKLVKDDYNGWGMNDSKRLGNSTEHAQTHGGNNPIIPLNDNISVSVSSVPSAPPIPEEVFAEGPIHYSPIDIGVDVSTWPIDNEVSTSNDSKAGNDSSSCVICWEAPIEGACIPCGHMACCMSCLDDIKAKMGVCPICRSKMNQVVKVYAV